jgi:predicted transcriptional regulator of viral defense system
MSIINHMSIGVDALTRMAAKSVGKAVFQSRDFERAGLHPEQVRRLVRDGRLQRAGRGRYMLPDAEPSADIGLALASAAAPAATVCLITALRWHEIGTQAPREIWLAVDRRAAKPRIDFPPVRIVRFSGRSLTFGVQQRKVDGVPLRIYSPAKTVADCFKYRNKIGLDVALEALKAGLTDKRFTRDELWAAAEICRVTSVVRPFLQAL